MALLFFGSVSLLFSIVVCDGTVNDAMIAGREIDILSPVGLKDTTVYRYALRHALKYVQHVRHVYVVTRPTLQMESIVAYANAHDVQQRDSGRGSQQVFLVDEGRFPFGPSVIRKYLKHHRQQDGFNGQPFDGSVTVPQQCDQTRQRTSTKEYIKACRQPSDSEVNDLKARYGERNVPRVEKFDRTGWLFQQFIKLGATIAIPGILDYMILDSDTVFYRKYSPFPPGPSAERVSNFMPGDGRDCKNPPYLMTMDALGIKEQNKMQRSCAGRGPKRKCSTRASFCPIAHQMMLSRDILAALWAHIESKFASEQNEPSWSDADAAKQRILWWQGVLRVIPAWSTSPFSEYLTYYHFASTRFPDRVKIYDADQLGASEEEIPANYYMGNSRALVHDCALHSIESSPQVALGQLCDNDMSNKRKDACETYNPDLHNNSDVADASLSLHPPIPRPLGDHQGRREEDVPPPRSCPAPVYESYHGFRNTIPPQIIGAFERADGRNSDNSTRNFIDTAPSINSTMKQDYSKARKLFEKAAKQGDGDAMAMGRDPTPTPNNHLF